MMKSYPLVAAMIVGAGLALLAPAAAPAQEIIGPDADACRPGAVGPAALVRVYGFKARTGNLRVQLYGDNPDEFLAKGRKLKRIDLPITPEGDMNVCMSLPGVGTYGMAVRHDVDGNGKSGWNDGGGFSGNPKISLTDLKPSLDEVAFIAGDGVVVLDVVLNYRKGLKIGPIAARRE